MPPLSPILHSGLGGRHRSLAGRILPPLLVSLVGPSHCAEAGGQRQPRLFLNCDQVQGTLLQVEESVLRFLFHRV